MRDAFILRIRQTMSSLVSIRRTWLVCFAAVALFGCDTSTDVTDPDAPGPLASAASTLRVENQTSESIVRFYLAECTSMTWGQNRLGSNPIAPGASRTFTLTPGCYASLAVLNSGEEIETGEGTLAAGRSYVHAVRSSGPTQTQPVTLVVDNRSSERITEYYYITCGQSSWGSNRLAGSSIGAGQNWRVSLAAGCYHLLAKSSTGTAHELRNNQYSSGGTYTHTLVGGTTAPSPATVRVDNQTAETIVGYYYTACGGQYGANLLAGSSIGRGQSRSFTFTPGCYHLAAMSSTSVKHEVLNVQLQAGATFTHTLRGGPPNLAGNWVGTMIRSDGVKYSDWTLPLSQTDSTLSGTMSHALYSTGSMSWGVRGKISATGDLSLSFSGPTTNCVALLDARVSGTSFSGTWVTTGVCRGGDGSKREGTWSGTKR